MAKSKKPAARVTQKAKAEGRAMVAKSRRKRRSSEEVAKARAEAAKLCRVYRGDFLLERVKSIELDPEASEYARGFAAQYRTWEKEGAV